MRSIGRAGWSSHGYFGFAAQTFGNPDGATSGGGAWTGVTNQGGDGAAAGLGKGLRDGGLNPNGPNQGGGGGPVNPGLTWTYRGNVTVSVPILGVASDAAGNTLLIDLNGHVKRSTDGGHTWSAWSAIGGFAAVASFGFLYEAGGTWMFSCAQTGGASFLRSTDGGVTWTAITSGISSAGFISLGTDGAGNWFGIGNSVNAPPTFYGFSVDDGVTWTSAGVTTVGGPGACQILWDTAHAQWVIPGTAVGSFNGTFWTSPDALTWTAIPVTSTQLLTPLFKVGADYYACDNINGFTFSPAATLAAVAAEAGPGHATGIGGASFAFAAGANFFVLDGSNGVANAPDFETWLVGTLNYTLGTETTNAACYDSTHGSAIAASNGGSICTYP